MEPIKEFVSRRKTVLFAVAIFIMLNTFVAISTIKNSTTLAIVVFLSILLEIAISVATLKLEEKEVPLEKIFLIMVIPLGILFIALLPCGESPDEATHFYRIYGISDGVLIPKTSESINGGSALPERIEEVFIHDPAPGTYEKLTGKLEISSEEEKRDIDYVTAALYNPICYIPQVVGILIGKILRAPILIQAYIARVLNFTLFLALSYFAIKLMPKYKHFLAFLLLLPMTLQEATSLSPDAMTIGLVSLLIAFVLNIVFLKDKPLNSAELASLYIIAGILGFCKIVYLPLLLLYFLIPYKRFGGKKQKTIHASLMIVLVILLNVSWLIISSRYLIEVKEGVNPASQANHLFHNPLQFMIVIFRTIASQIDYYVASTFGMSLGHFSINLPRFYFYIIFAMAIIVLMKDSEEYFTFTKQARVVFMFTFSITVLLIFTSLYLQWTPVGEENITGIQGRYFIPILPLLPFIIHRNREGVTRKKYEKYSTLLIPSLFIDMCSIICIVAVNI